MNRKQSRTEIFNDCAELDYIKIQSMYSRIKIFSKCEMYNKPDLIDSRCYSNLEINTYTMKSKYSPINAFQNLYSLFWENRNIYFEVIKACNSKKQQKISLIYLHGFSERSYENEIKYLFSKLIVEIPHIEIIAVHLPYHMKRSPEGQPYSGAYIFDSNPIVTIEGFRQAVNDISQILSYAREKYERVIIGGFSLGGFVTSLLGTCDDRADLYIIGQAGAHLPRTLKNLRVCPGLYAKKERWIKQGIDFESLYSPIELLNYKPLVPPEKVVSIAGLYDKLIRFEDVKKLRHLYKSSYNINYFAGHIGLLFETKKVKIEVMSVIDNLVMGVKKSV